MFISCLLQYLVQFKLAQQWPPSHCNGQKKCKLTPPSTYFTTHGLWPDNFNGPLLQHCPGAAYVPITDANLLRQMNKDWPDLENNLNHKFWAHEWSTHGTCSSMAQTDYFKKTLALRNNYNVYTHLSNNGIKPGKTASYQESAIRNLVKQWTSKDPDLNCNKDSSKTLQLHEVRICFDPNYAVIDCPNRPFANN